MSKEADAAEKAELIQSIKALMIPLSLFLACVIMAAGVFLLYNSESVGWFFVAASVAMLVTAFVALIRFQNKYRARGIIRSQFSGEDAEELLVFDPEQHGVGTTPRPADRGMASSSK